MHNKDMNKAPQCKGVDVRLSWTTVQSITCKTQHKVPKARLTESLYAHFISQTSAPSRVQAINSQFLSQRRPSDAPRSSSGEAGRLDCWRSQARLEGQQAFSYATLETLIGSGFHRA
jgi:hypothetical protein